MIMQDDFLNHQLSFLHVQSAAAQHDFSLQYLFQKNKLSYPAKQLYIQVFKQEQLLEVWASNDVRYKRIKTYQFTAMSGKLGPKQQEGDLQIPEGFYQLERFNPESKFYLSLKINYPNQADSSRNKDFQNLGGDIYIHGGEKTTGCISIGDIAIAELYWICVKSFAINSVIPIHIFPFKMEEKNLTGYYKKKPEHISFWNSLKPMYQFFQSKKLLSKITDCDVIGNY